MQGFLVSHAVYAIVLFGVLEAMCVPISSELTFLLGGAVAAGAGGVGVHQHPSLALVIALGIVAELVGSFISYGVGRAGGRPLVNRWGKYLLVTHKDVDRAERFLVGRGAWALPVARMLPVIRAFASIVAGVVEIPPLRFGLLNLIGTAVYVAAIASVGYSLGGEWTKFNKTFSDVSYVLVGLVVIAIIVYVFYRLREFRKESAYAARHGGTTHTGPDRERSGRLYQHRPCRGGACGHRRAGGHERDLTTRSGQPGDLSCRPRPRDFGYKPRSASSKTARYSRPRPSIFGRAPRSTRTATPTTSAPASASASTAASTEPPVVEVSSTASTRLPLTSGPSILRCRPWAFSVLRTTNASMGVPRLAAAASIAYATGSAPRVRPPTAS